MYAGWVIHYNPQKIILVKLPANENFPISSVLLLRDHGYDIISIGEEYSGVSDEYVMHLAQSEKRIIITFDRDYGELIYKYNFKPPKGVIYLRLNHYTPEEPGNIVEKLFRDYKIETDRSLTVFDGFLVRQRKY